MDERIYNQLNTANFWAAIKSNRDRVLSARARPVLVIDLDGTIVDYTMRTYRIFQDAIRNLGLPDDINEKVNDIRPEDYDYYPKSDLAKSGIRDEEAIRQLTDFWNDNYFTGRYLEHDRQMPGAHRFVENILALDIDVVYLTGRDEQNMGDGTRAWLNHHGFLRNGNNRRRLLMKMDLRVENYVSKAQNADKIKALGEPVLIIDNEPIELQTMSGRFPEASIVLMDMPNSGKPAVLPDDILRLKDFDELNSLYKN